MKSLFLFLLLIIPSGALAFETNQWEVRTAPIAFIARWFTFEGLYRPNPSWALGGSYVKYSGSTSGSMFWPSDRGYSAGLVGTYYFDPVMAESWYATARLHHEKFTSYGHNSEYDYEYKGNSLMAVGGFRVAFLGNFFAMSGLGVQLGLYDRVEIKTARGTNAVTYSTKPNMIRVLPYLEAKIGAEF